MVIFVSIIVISAKKTLSEVPGTFIKMKEGSSCQSKLRDIQRLSSYVLAEFMLAVQNLSFKEEPKIDFEKIMVHCRNFDIAQTHADLARKTLLSPTTIHELATGKHLPSIGNLLRIAVICEVSLIGLIFPLRWSTSIEDIYDVDICNMPEKKVRKKYDWAAIERQVRFEIESGKAVSPHEMARAMGICEKQFCLKLENIIFKVRQAAAQNKLNEKAKEYLELRGRVFQVLQAATNSNERTSITAISRSVGICLNNKMYQKAYGECRRLICRRLAKIRASTLN